MYRRLEAFDFPEGRGEAGKVKGEAAEKGERGCPGVGFQSRRPQGTAHESVDLVVTPAIL
jgi:hypothetical protein